MKPALRMQNNASTTKPQAITPGMAVTTLNAIVELLGVKPEELHDASNITARITAIKAERDQLRAKLDEMSDEIGKKNHEAFKSGAGDANGQHKVVVAASRQSSDADEAIVKEMIGDKSGGDIEI